MLMFFFFQAEDGIRDADVTGVQTCALPISHRASSSTCATHRLSRVGSPSAMQPAKNFLVAARPSSFSGSSRSEERRVGKSVELGGRRSIKKKKRRGN